MFQVAAFRPWTEFLEAWLERTPAKMHSARAKFPALRIMDDPEAIFQEAWLFCDVGEDDHGLDLVRRAVGKGYFVAPTLVASRSFDGLRDRADFREVLAQAGEGRARALAVFRENGGERLLGR